MSGRTEQVTEQQLWGAETRKAVENFQISGEPIPRSVVHWLGRIKAAAARTNAELELLDSDIGERIARAADEIAAGEHDAQFPIDVFQTGSGTSSHTNANEVIATLAGDGVHSSDHVNMGQSRTTSSRPRFTWRHSTRCNLSSFPRSRDWSRRLPQRRRSSATS